MNHWQSEMTECDWLQKWDLYAPHREALIDGDTGVAWTYRRLYQRSRNMAFVLRQRLGICNGDRVAVLALNDLEYVALFFALSHLGATLVPINYRLTTPEVAHILEDCGARLVIYQDAFAGVLESLPFDDFAKGPEVAGGKDPNLRRATKIRLNEGDDCVRVMTDRIESDAPVASVEVKFESQFEDIAMVIYTSGTTGFPKGAMISHRMLFWNSMNTTQRLNISQSDSAVIFLPFFHTGGWNVLTTPFFHRGAQVILLKKFDADQILHLSEKYQCNLLFGVPTTMDMMARSPFFPTVNLRSVRYAIVGGEPMPVPLIEKWHGKGIKIRQGYGLTEFGPNVFSLNEEEVLRKIGSIGFPNFYIQTKVVDDQGQEVGADEVGELYLKGPSVMSGYLGNEKATAATFDGEWLKTGDLVRYDKEGFFYVVGRKKEMYKSGGENVYPAEVEKVIRGLKGIREVAVVGVPDSKWGEVGKAFVATEPNIQMTEQQIFEHCLQNLAKFKVPRQIQFMESLPKGDSGKILKKNLTH